MSLCVSKICHICQVLKIGEDFGCRMRGSAGGFDSASGVVFSFEHRGPEELLCWLRMSGEASFMTMI